MRRVGGTRKGRARPKLRPAPDRLLTHSERLAIRTSKLWVAGYPQLVAEWHATKNIDVYPYEVRYAANRRIHWKCAKGQDHQWQQRPSDRTRGGKIAPCPFCSGRRVSITNCLETVAPELAKELHPTRNGKLTPRTLSTHNSKFLWWCCPVGPRHVYQARVSDRVVRGVGCPYCARKRLPLEHALSSVAPAVAKRWHPTKNGKVKPSDVSARSADYAWFVCSVRHSFRTKIKRMVDDPRCPYCEGWEVAKDTSLAARNPELAAEWHRTKNGKTTPESVSPRSAEEVWWRCPLGRDHIYAAKVWDRAMRGRGCPFCLGRRLSTTTSLAARFPKIARDWHPTKNGKLTADAVRSGDRRSVWWRCSEGHVWRAGIVYRTRSPRCAQCSKRGRGRTIAA